MNQTVAYQQTAIGCLRYNNHNNYAYNYYGNYVHNNLGFQSYTCSNSANRKNIGCKCSRNDLDGHDLTLKICQNRINQAFNSKFLQSGVYIVGTPIGNVEDISIRALRVLHQVDIIYAEDTRVTRKLLDYYGINTKLISCHSYIEQQRASVAAQQASTGMRVAVVSDAGLPGISDPGSRVIQAALANNIPVHVVSGPCAALQSVVESGVDPTRFVYLGFMSPKRGARRKLLARAQAFGGTCVTYVSPRTIVDTLCDALEVFGADTWCCIARDLTKPSEVWYRGTIQQALNVWNTISKDTKCELSIVFEGSEQKLKREKGKGPGVHMVSTMDDGSTRTAASRTDATVPGWVGDERGDGGVSSGQSTGGGRGGVWDEGGAGSSAGDGLEQHDGGVGGGGVMGGEGMNGEEYGLGESEGVQQGQQQAQRGECQQQTQGGQERVSLGVEVQSAGAGHQSERRSGEQAKVTGGEVGNQGDILLRRGSYLCGEERGRVGGDDEGDEVDQAIKVAVEKGMSASTIKSKLSKQFGLKRSQIQSKLLLARKDGRRRRN